LPESLSNEDFQRIGISQKQLLAYIQCIRKGRSIDEDLRKKLQSADISILTELTADTVRPEQAVKQTIAKPSPKQQKQANKK